MRRNVGVEVGFRAIDGNLPQQADLGELVQRVVDGGETNPPGQQAPAQGLASLWWADTLATLMNQQVTVAAFWSASGINSPYPLLTTQGQQQTAMLRVMQIFSHLQNNLVPIQTQRDPISLYATQDNAHRTVSLLFINKSNMPQLAQISTANQFLSIGAWPTPNVSIAGYSMVVVILHRGGGAEAYSYIPPTTNDENVTPVNPHGVRPQVKRAGKRYTMLEREERFQECF